ncbi:hypothetical protein [Salmonirosea aquatica]|uniref:Uncharacterized protein n=1 Tax=Salmonirosea aquatica TaxID=2654236 RepID=A0A7C9BD26_9BACT|nr:hypothetical protein [Cytophagaceae bacterium SJW1-29]
MDTTQQASDFLKQENMAFWQLWKGTSKVSECEKDNNPTADPATPRSILKTSWNYCRPTATAYRYTATPAASGAQQL